jgi:prevent-host-death family protein
MQVNILEAKNRLSELIKCTLAGEEVIIANRGQPVVRLVPADVNLNSTAAQGTGHDILNWLKVHQVPDYLKRSAEEIDADIETERNSWD